MALVSLEGRVQEIHHLPEILVAMWDVGLEAREMSQAVRQSINIKGSNATNRSICGPDGMQAMNMSHEAMLVRAACFEDSVAQLDLLDHIGPLITSAWHFFRARRSTH